MRELVVLASFLSLPAAVAQAQSVVARTEGVLVPDAAEISDYFGQFVALDGDTAIVSASGGGLYGELHVFARTGSSWSLRQILRPPDATAGFGLAVALSADRLVVGAAEDDDQGPQAGAAYVYQRQAGLWTLQAKLAPAELDAGDWFGRYVAIDGDVVAVSAIRDDDVALDAGATYVFRWNGAHWEQEVKLLASDGAQGDSFGSGVDVDGDALATTAFRGPNSGDAGAAYVFVRAGGVWTEQASLEPLDSHPSQSFGRAVALQGDRLVVGARSDSALLAEAGAAYVFVRSGDVWTQSDKLSAVAAQAHSWFGSALALDGDRLVVGAFWDTSGAGGSNGTVHLFELDAQQDWIARGELLPPETNVHGFGFTVELEDHTVLAGVSGSVLEDEVFVLELLEEAVGTPLCAGDGGGTPCPCANPGDPGHGCANGADDRGARLFADGSASVAAGDLALAGYGLVPLQTGIYFQGDQLEAGGAGAPLGDGLRCAGGVIRRLGVRVADGVGTSTLTIDPGAIEGIAAGETRAYQVWYRDPQTSLCGAGFNLSNALSVAFTP